MQEMKNNMQQKSLKNRLVLLILFIIPITNFLSIYRFYTGRVLLGIVRIILFIAFCANEQNENIMAISLLAWMAITVIDFILILFGKFKDKNKMPISSFNPKKDYEKFLAEKRIEEESTKKSEEPIKKITEQKNTDEKEVEKKDLNNEAKEDSKEETNEKVKQDSGEGVNEEVKVEREEYAKEVVSEEVKEEPKEETTEEVKEEPKGETTEEVKGEPKEETTEEVKEEPKEEATEEVKEEAKVETIKESKHAANEGVKEETEEKMKEDVEENSKEEEKEDSTGVVKEGKKDEVNEESKKETKEDAREDVKEERLKEAEKNEKMTLAEKLKAIYDKTHPNLSCCTFAPDLDVDEWVGKLNMLAEEEEPLSVVCIGNAPAKGLLQAMFSASAFLFTNKKLYMEKDEEGIKLSSIKSISYTEGYEESLFGKIKVIGYIRITLSDGNSKNLAGAYATREIAEFLNNVQLAIKENPPKKLPKVNTSCVDLIAGEIKKSFHQLEYYWKFKPNIPQRKLNSLIIRCLKKDLKSSCAAYWEWRKTRVLYFFSDMLVEEYDPSGYDDSQKSFKVIKYKDLTGVSYSEGDYTNSRSLKLIAKNNEEILCLEEMYNQTGSPLDESYYQLSVEAANFFSWLISEGTGVKTEAKIIGKKATKEVEKIRKEKEDEEIKQKERRKNPMLKKIMTKDYTGHLNKELVPITDQKDREALKNILKKWNEIFKGDDSWKSQRTSSNTDSYLDSNWGSYLGDTYWQNIKIDSNNKYTMNDKWLIFTDLCHQKEVDSHSPSLGKITEIVDHTMAFAYFPKTSYDEEGDKSIDGSKALFLILIQPYPNSRRITFCPEFKLIMRSEDITLEFESNSGFKYSELGIFGFPTFFDDMEAFKKKLDEIDKKHLEDIENNARNEIADW